MRRVFRLLLHLWPPAFRRRFGAEVVEQAMDDHARAAGCGGWRRWRVGVATAGDLILSGLAEWFEPTWTPDERERRTEKGATRMMNTILRDLRQAVRSLIRVPGFTLTAVATLALALGANAAIFSVVDAVVLRPLPYAAPDQLVTITGSAPGAGADMPDEFDLSNEFLVQYRDGARQLDGVASVNGFTNTVRTDDRVERLSMSMPSISLFPLLGVRAELGRWPQKGEGGQVAVLSHALWMEWFGGDPDVVGRSLFVSNGQKTIIGVMPPEFRVPTDATKIWAPVEITEAGITPGRFGSARLLARLADGADGASVDGELTELARRLPERFGGSPAYARVLQQFQVVVRPLDEVMLGPIASALWVLMGAVAVVLLIACANVANLFTVRAEARGRDLSVRRAIGADRRRLVTALMAEAVVVAGAAAVAAVVLVAVTLPLYLAVAPGGVPRIDEVHLSATTLVFTALAAGAAAIVCGLIPALRASKPDLRRLRDGSRGTTRRRHWMRDGLVVAQTALALVLLVGSGLLLRSVQRLGDRDPGYDTHGVLTFQFAPEQEHLVDGPSWAGFHLNMMDRLRALPGVEKVGIVENVPLDESVRSMMFWKPDESTDDPDAGIRAGATFAGGDYFEAMGVDLLKGRVFTNEDLETPGRAVVSRTFADRMWPGEDPVGRAFVSAAVADPYRVVGVVEDVVQTELRDTPEPLVYYPMVGPTPDAWRLGSPGYVVRSEQGEALMPGIRTLIHEVAPEAPIYRVHTMAELAARSTVQLRFTMLTMAVAAGLALVLGAIGLYGVLSYIVAQRAREIGVRMALGAEAARVRRMVVAQGVRVVAVGILLGLAVAFVSTRVLGSLLWGVEAVDPTTFVGTAAAMAVVGLLASWIPALRASRVDPIRSMREV